MGTEISKFGPWEAEKIVFKDSNLHSEIMTRMQIYQHLSTQQKRLCLRES